MATTAMQKRWTALSSMTRNANHKKASHCEEDSAQEVQASLNSALTPMQGATGTNVGVAVVNTHAILPGHQLLRQTAAYEAPESPSEQPVQTRQEPMHTDMSRLLWVRFAIAWLHPSRGALTWNGHHWTTVMAPCLP